MTREAFRFVLTASLGRAVARALLPVALVAAPTVFAAQPASAATQPRAVAPTVLAPVASVGLMRPAAIPSSGAARLAAARRAAAARAARARAAHLALVLRRDNAVVHWALAQVGARYLAGGAGSGGFDCSGLTLAAWATQGVALPHYSAAQYARVTHIPTSALRPGDLVFYLGNGAHHVALYVGHGMMVSADDPWHGVRLEPFLWSWFGWHYTGAGRVLN